MERVVGAVFQTLDDQEIFPESADIAAAVKKIKIIDNGIPDSQIIKIYFFQAGEFSSLVAGWDYRN